MKCFPIPLEIPFILQYLHFGSRTLTQFFRKKEREREEGREGGGKVRLEGIYISFLLLL